MKIKPIVLLGALLASANAIAADSSISITGYVRDNTCAVAGQSQDFIVDLLNNATKQFHIVGATTPLVPFQIVLAPCGGTATAVRVSFSGVGDSNNASLVKLDSGAGAATGMGVQILDANRTAIPLNAALATIPWITLRAGQTNTLNFYARLMASRVPVTAGHVSAAAAFTLEFL